MPVSAKAYKPNATLSLYARRHTVIGETYGNRGYPPAMLRSVKTPRVRERGDVRGSVWREPVRNRRRSRLWWQLIDPALVTDITNKMLFTQIHYDAKGSVIPDRKFLFLLGSKIDTHT